MCQKFTKMEHTNKIGFLVGTNSRFSNIEFYGNMIKETIKDNVDEFELNRILQVKKKKNQNIF